MFIFLINILLLFNDLITINNFEISFLLDSKYHTKAQKLINKIIKALNKRL